MKEKTARQFFLIFSFVASPFSLAILGNFSRFWGRSFLVQILLFLILDMGISLVLFSFLWFINKRIKNPPPLDHYKYLVVPFLLGLLFMVRLPIWQPPLPLHRIQINISEDENPQSTNAHIELVEFKYAGRIIPLEELEQQGAWVNQNGILSSNRSYGKGLSYQGEPELYFPSTQLNLTFATSSDSGMVEISTDGGSMQKYDLFSTSPNRLIINLNLEKNGNLLFVTKVIQAHSLTIAAILLVILIIGNVIFFNEKSFLGFFEPIIKTIKNVIKKISARVVVTIFLVLLGIIFLICWIFGTGSNHEVNILFLLLSILSIFCGFAFRFLNEKSFLPQ